MAAARRLGYTMPEAERIPGPRTVRGWGGDGGGVETETMEGTRSPVRRGPCGGPSPRRRSLEPLPASTVVFIFWLLFSASLQPLDLALGAALSWLLGWWATHFLWAGQAPGISARQLLALLQFLCELGAEVVHAALQVASLVVDPQLPIEPRFIICRTRLKRQISRVAFAHSVTLTPGTLTVDVAGGSFLVHCLSEQFAERLRSGALERRIARIFEAEAAP